MLFDNMKTLSFYSYLHMEIQPASSVSQATALFTGLTAQQVKDSIRRIYPYPAINTNLHSKHALEAISSTGSFKDYREKDYIEAHRLLQGIITNPWRDIHDIEIGKTDPFHIDSGISEIGDIQQKTMGTVTGAPFLNDPREHFAENILKLKTFQREVDNNLSYNYMKDLFLTQLDNGSTYYQKQAIQQNEALAKEHLDKQNKVKPLDHHVMIKSTNYGNMTAPHPKRPRQIMINSTPYFSHNVKRAKLDDLHDRFSAPIKKQPPNYQVGDIQHEPPKIRNYPQRPSSEKTSKNVSIRDTTETQIGPEWMSNQNLFRNFPKSPMKNDEIDDKITPEMRRSHEYIPKTRHTESGGTGLLDSILDESITGETLDNEFKDALNEENYEEKGSPTPVKEDESGSPTPQRATITKDIVDEVISPHIPSKIMFTPPAATQAPISDVPLYQRTKNIDDEDIIRVQNEMAMRKYMKIQEARNPNFDSFSELVEASPEEERMLERAFEGFYINPPSKKTNRPSTRSQNKNANVFNMTPEQLNETYLIMYSKIGLKPSKERIIRNNKKIHPGLPSPMT